MKKYLYILSALAVAVSCAPKELEAPVNVPTGREMTFTAYFDDALTRNTLVDGTKVYWLPGDDLAVFYGYNSSYFCTDIQEMAAVCSFTGTIDPADKYYAFYPYEAGYAFDGETYRATVPKVQEATDGNVSNRLLFSAGVSASDGTIAFRNIVSGICFTLSSEGVKYVELKGNNSEFLAGGIKIDMRTAEPKTEPLPEFATNTVRLNAPDGGSFKPNTSYYIVCAPSTFEKGLTLEMFKEDGSSAVCSLEKHIELKRSVFGRINLADKGQEYTHGGIPEGQMPPDNEIWYTTTDNKPLAYLREQRNNALESSTYSKGLGILRFSQPLTRVELLSDESSDGERLTNILLPDCVEYIGEGFLLTSYGIKEFHVPASLKETGGSSFISRQQAVLERFTGSHVSEDGRCLIIDGVLHGFAPAGLQSYTFPSGIVTLQTGVCALGKELLSAVLPSGLKEIRAYAFQQSSLESITIPASVEAMHAYTFIRCTHLKNLLGDSHFISEDRKFLYDANAFLPMLLFHFVGRDDESYEIPEGINAIENYAFYGCDKLKSIKFPRSLSFIAGEAFLGCDNLDTILGDHATKDHKGYVNESRVLQFLVPNIGEDYVIPDDVTGLGNNLFSYRQDLRSVKMGDQVTSFGNYVFSYCTNLKTVVLSANLNTIGYNPFQGSKSLEAVYLRSIIPPTYSDKQYTQAPDLVVYVPSGSYKLYKRSAGWKQYWDVMQPYDYTDLPELDYYVSQDYSKEGEVTVYQRASEGKGIDLVFMGDGYSDREVESGKYVSDMTGCAEEFFNVEPYKSFRHLFNIYFVTAVSATEGYEHGGRSLGSSLGLGTYIGGDDEKCFELALNAVKDESRLDDTLVIVCGNQDRYGPHYAGTCFMYEPGDWAGRDYANGPAVTYFLKLHDSFEETGDVIRHEAGGHGFAKLADEYNYSGSLSQRDRDDITDHAPYRWYSNVDITSNPATIKWSAFLADERYQYDEVGIFEGGFTYEYGVWRPSLTSIMLDNTGRYNAPSRYTIWYRIHKLAYGDSWNGTYEDFVAYDAVNRITSGSSGARVKGNCVERQPQMLHAPVSTGRSWREAGKRN